MDFSKTFDCVHDLVISKLAVNGFDKIMLCYIYSYVESRNKQKSTSDEIISGVPQGSIVGPIL